MLFLTLSVSYYNKNKQQEQKTTRINQDQARLYYIYLLMMYHKAIKDMTREGRETTALIYLEACKELEQDHYINTANRISVTGIL